MHEKSHTFSVFYKGGFSFLCTRNGKCIVHIAYSCKDFTTLWRIMQPKLSDWLKKFVKKQTISDADYNASCNGKVNCFK